MQKTLHLIVGFVLTVFISNCTNPDHGSVLFPVPTLRVDEGTTRGFDLSVYKRSLDVQLSINEDIPGLDLSWIAASDSLIITPRDTRHPLIRIPVMVDGETQYLLARIMPMVKHTFTYKPETDVEQVVVMGGFNDWSRTALPLSDSNGDGILERTVYLKPQRHEYKFVVDHEELIDPENPVFVSNNIGGWNSILDLSDQKEKTTGEFVKQSWTGTKLRFGYLPPEDGALPVKREVFFNNRPLHPDAVDPLPDGGVVVNIGDLEAGILRITGWDEHNRVIRDNLTILKNGKPLNPKDHPGDWHFAVLYNLMIDRFNDGNPENTKPIDDPELHDLANFHGGDFAGIIEKLESGYFDRLGISAIWISPIQMQPQEAYREAIPPHRKFSGYHGYWPVLPREIDPRFGTPEELHRLVSLAHEQGIKVILDFVSNHVHENHPYFTEHRDWFCQVENPDGSLNIRNWSEETRLTTWFDIFLPSFNYPEAPEAIQQVVDDAVWWLETYKFDGFRQDAVKHVPHAFWRELTYAMRQKFPDKHLYQIGETFGSDELIMSYVNPGELDAQFNFAIYFNVRGPLVEDRGNFDYLADVIDNNLVSVGPVHLMGNITSSHDQLRFIGLADGQVAFSDNGMERAFNDPPGPVQDENSYKKLANFHALNMALPGLPVIYYGDEIGLMGAGDPGNRRPLRFSDDLSTPEKQLLKTVSDIAHLRAAYPSLALGDYHRLKAEGPVLAFAKRYFDETVVFVIYQDATDTTVSLNLPWPVSHATDILSDRNVPLENNRLTVEMAPYSFAFIRLGNER